MVHKIVIVRLTSSLTGAVARAHTRASILLHVFVSHPVINHGT